MIFLSLFFLSILPLTQEDLTLHRFYQSHYEKSGIHESSIPKKLHVIWLGPNNFPSLKNIQKWQELHPRWEIYFWTDRERHLPLKGINIRLVKDFHFHALADLYDLSDNYGEKSELLRYEILFQEGGVYVDHDTLPLKPLDDLKADFFAGLAKEGSSVLSGTVYPSTHLIGSKPNHPIFKKSFIWLKDKWDQLEKEYPGNDASSVYNRVKHRSFSAFKEGVETYLSEKDLILPEKNLRNYVMHQQAGTWYDFSSERERKLLDRLQKIERKANHLEKILVCMGLLSVTFLVFRVKKTRKFLPLVLLFLASCQQEDSPTEFEHYMGKQTEHWKYIQSEEDKCSFAYFEALYEKNKHYLTEKCFEQKIPHVIHFIWLGPRPFPPQSVDNVRSWIAHNPHWKVKFWTDRERPLPCTQMELCNVADFPFIQLRGRYEESQNYGEKSDLLRYEILLQEGGVYADHDANCLCPFERLHANFDFYCGLEAPHPPFVGHNFTTGNGVLGARPGHPTIQKVIEWIDIHWNENAQLFRGRDNESKVQLVLARTYMALTHSLQSTIDRQNNIDIVLPSAYFFAKTGIPSLYSKHFYATAWADGNHSPSLLMKQIEKKVSLLQKKETKMTTIAFALLCSQCFVALFFFVKKK